MDIISETPKTEVKAPWLKNYGDIPATLEYPTCTMFERLEQIANDYPEAIAFDFMGKKTKYKDLIKQIHICARALKAIGTRSGDKITICMPNCPQAVIVF